MKRIIAAIVIAASTTIASAQQSTRDYPGVAFVNDYADVLPPEAEIRLAQIEKQIEADTTAQVVVLTIRNLPSDAADMQQLGYILAHKWPLGRRDASNGVIVMLDISDHLDRIEVGSGAESVITDAVAHDMLQSARPAFREGRYEDGLRQILTRIGALLRASPVRPAPVSADNRWWLLIVPFSLLGGIYLLTGIRRDRRDKRRRLEEAERRQREDDERQRMDEIARLRSAPSARERAAWRSPGTTRRTREDEEPPELEDEPGARRRPPASRLRAPSTGRSGSASRDSGTPYTSSDSSFGSSSSGSDSSSGGGSVDPGGGSFSGGGSDGNW